MKTYPFTRTQMGIFLAAQNAQGNENYNIRHICQLPPDVQIPRLKEALCKVFDNHAAFKAHVTTNDDDMPCIAHHTDDTIVIHELEMQDIDELKLKALDFPFDIMGGPLYQLWIVHTAQDNNYWLAVIVHHLISDGMSNSIFFRDLHQAYQGKALMPEAKTLFDLCLDEEKEREGDAYTAAKAYYTQAFADAVDLVTYPTEDVPSPVVPVDEQWNEIEVPLTANRKVIKQMCKKYNVATDMVFYAAFGYVMAKLSNDDKALFATIYNGRSSEETACTMAMMVQTCPVFIDFSDKASIGDLLSRLHQQLKSTRQNTLYSFGEVNAELGIKPMTSIAYHGTLHDLEVTINQENCRHIHPIRHAPGFNLSFAICQVGDQYRIRVFHNRNHHTAAYIKNICICIDNVLFQMAEGKAFADIQLLNDAQTAEVTALSRGESMEYDDRKTAVALIMRHARSTPNALAVADAETTLTYAQLDSMTNTLAHVLLDQGVQKNQFVGVMMDRSVNFPLTAFAIHKAGAAYMPLDVDYPNERLSYMIENSEATVLVTTHAVLEAKQAEGGLSTEGLHIIYIEELDLHAPSEPVCLATPDSLAYMIYTSGSTGKPKGAMLHQRGLLNFTLSIADTEELTATDRIASHRSFSFDAHIGDLYPVLAKGGSLHIMPSQIRKDLQAMYQFIVDNRITGFGCTTSLMMLLLNNYDLPVRFVTAGGEKLSGVESNHIRIINLYGPTECTNDATLYVIEPGRKVANIPIGRPLHNMTCLVMSKDGKLLPQGAPGELCIAGVQVGRGYWRLPEKTAEAFADSPLAEGSKLYHTGDLVRWNTEDQLEYLGRIDGQVKLRGFRIEMGEIEATALQVEGIKQAAAAVKQVGGNKQLVLYYTLNEGAAVTDQDVSAHIEASTLADYMHPEIYQHLDVMPQLPNGKIDRKHLPEPVVEVEEASESPRELNILEKTLSEMVASLLGIESIGVHAPLRKYGMSSLVSMRLAAKLFKQYGINMKGREIAAGTILDIENAILSKAFCQPAASTVSETSADPHSGKEALPVSAATTAPLSFTQQGVYADCQIDPESTRYNIPLCYKVPKGVQADALERALKAVVAAHPYVFCHFVEDEKGEIVQKPLEGVELTIAHKSLSLAELEAEKKAFVRPFHLAEGPLVRFEMAEVEDSLYLLMDMHHLVSDGASANLFMQQLCGALDGVMPEKESYTYYDFVGDEAITPETEAFFADRMARIENSTQLIPDVFEQNLPHTKGNVSAATDFATVKAWAASHEVNPSAVYLAATFLTLSRYVCEDNVNLCTISNGRSNLRISETMGMFVNTLVLQSYIDNAQPCADFIRLTSDGFLATIDHENYPFARIAAKYDYQPNTSFAYQVGVHETHKVAAGAFLPEPMQLEVAKIGINIMINGNEETGYGISIDYDEALYSRYMMQQLALSVENAVQGLICSEKLGDVSITSASQWEELDKFNAQLNIDYNHNDTVVTAFKRMAQLHPDQTAVVYGDTAYSYSELDRFTDRLAVRIRERMLPYIEEVEGMDVVQDGTKLTDVVVSILIHRNEWMMLASLAVLKAGCGYQPLDPSYPQDRLNFMAKDASARMLIADEDLRPLLNEYEGEVLLTKDIADLISNVPEGSVDYSRKEGLVTLLYTSGSTGLPKGCMLEHRNLVAFGHATRTTLDISTESRIAAYASFGFDVNMMDMYCTILNGGTMYIIPEDMRMNLDALHDYMEEEGITQIFMTTQVGVQYLENYPQSASLRRLAMGGEKLRAVDPSQLSYKIFNGYGPSEMTCGVSMFTIEHWEPNIPIGKPMATLQGYVVDKTGHRLPVGAAGELWITGPQVARGYLNRVDKTQEAFTANPFIEHVNTESQLGRELCGRIYHSGDIVRYREDGNVEFVGRKDGQVKVRGFRIELKEIEAVIRDFPGIKDVTVQAYDYEDGGKYIAAFVVSEGAQAVDVDALNAFIKSQKPPYMVPAVTMQIERIPLNVNQKVDKKALPKPEAHKAEYVAPKGKTEEDFCAIFSEITGVEKVSAEDDFFDIGGSSILALKVVIAAGKMGYTIVYNDVFTYTTPRMMADFVGHDEEPDEPMATTMPETGTQMVEVDEDGFDCHAINELLRSNTLEALSQGERLPLGDVLLTGATGFLGVHVLRDLIENYDNTIYCLVRGRAEKPAAERLQEYLTYYYGKYYAELMGSRIIVIEGDATVTDTFERIDEATGGRPCTVVNCAACVKHFAKGNEIEQINVGSVRNIVGWCLKSGNRLVHVSTESVFGRFDPTIFARDEKPDEHILYFGQKVKESQYSYSKYLAERYIYDAILNNGLQAKVMRVGNLAPRHADGEFQINYATNNMMNLFAAYLQLGMIPFSAMDTGLEFSPIDLVARAILLLSETPKECICFMPSNHHITFAGDIVMSIADTLGCELAMVDDKTFGSAVAKALEDPEQMDRMRPFMAYKKGHADTRLVGATPTTISPRHTVQTLYRLGFRWTATERAYMKQFTDRLSEKGFFSK